MKKMAMVGLGLGLALCLPSLGAVYTGGDCSVDNLIHRWSFSGNLNDSVGSANATSTGTVTFSNGQAVLPGGNSGAGYIDLGPGTLPTSGACTIEVFATPKSLNSWARVLSVGKNPAAGVSDPGANCDFFLMSWNGSGNLAQDQFRLCCSSATGAAGFTSSNELQPYTLNTEWHIAVVFDPLPNGLMKVTCIKESRDGLVRRVSTRTTPAAWSLAAIDPESFYLGHSRWSSDKDANATYNEVRIWNTALTEEQLAWSARLGADTLPTAAAVSGQTATVTVTAGSGGKVAIGAGAATTSASATVARNELVTLTATADNPTNDRFGAWSGDIGAIKEGSVSSATITVYAAYATSLTANFRARSTGDSSAYIQSGLTAQFDGYDNAGYFQHNASATTWKDITGHGYDATKSSSDVSWTADGWTNSKDGRPFALPSAFSTFMNGALFSIDFAVKPSRTNQRECFLSQYNNAGFGMEHNSGSASSGTIRFYYYGKPDLMSSVTSLANSADNFIYTAKSGAHVVYKNGVQGWTSNSAINTKPDTGKVFYIGGEGARTGMAFKGTWYSLRVYNRILTASEAAINSAIDQVRYCGKTVATVNSSLMPTGWKLTDDVLLRRQYGSSLTLGATDFLEEDSIEFTETSATTTLTFASLAASGATRTLLGELVANGPLQIVVPSAVGVGDWTLVDSKAVVCSANGSVTLAPECATGIGTARTLEVTGGKIILHVVAQSTDTLGTSKYIRDGLITFYDGFDNVGTGTQDSEATQWYDLSGHGHHARLTSQGSWSASGRYNEEDGRLAWIDRAYADMSATMTYTVEVVATPSDISRRFCYVGNYTGANAFSMGIENLSSPVGRLRWWNSAAPDWRPTIYAQQGETMIIAVTVRNDLKRAYKSGVLGASSTDGGTLESDGRETSLGGDNSRDNMAFKGTFQGLRLYNRPLSSEEIAVNAAIDRIRYGGDTRTLAELLPSGWSVQANGRYLRAFAGNETLENGTVVDGDATIAAGTHFNCTYPNGGFAQLRVTGTLTVAGDVQFKLPDVTDLRFKCGSYVLLEAADLPDNVNYTLDPATQWGDNVAAEISFVAGASKDQVVMRVYPVGPNIPSGNAQNNGRLGNATAQYLYWHPANEAEGTWSELANWKLNSYTGETSTHVAGHSPGTGYEYVIFPKGGVINFTSKDVWTHKYSYLTMMNGLSNPIVFRASDPSYGVDFRSQGTSAFTVTRGGNSEGSLRIESGTYDANYFDATGQDGSEYATGRFELAGGTVNIVQLFRAGWHDHDEAQIALSGGSLSVGGILHLAEGMNSTASYVQDGAEVSVTGDFRLGGGSQSHCDATLANGTLAVGGAMVFGNANTAGARFTLAGGRLVVNNITRTGTSPFMSFVFNGGTLVPPAATETWLAGSDFLAVASGATAKVDTDGKDATWKAALTDVNGSTNFSFEKLGAGTLSMEQLPTLAGTFTVTTGSVSLANAAIATNSVGTLALKGGAHLVLDVTAEGADYIDNTALDLSAATDENPAVIEVVYTGISQLAADTKRTLIARGVDAAALAKLRVAGTVDELAVEDGALVLKSSSHESVTYTWSGAANDGGKWSTGGNWSNNATPMSGDVASFNIAGSTTLFNLGDVLFESIAFGENAGAFTHTGEQVLKVKNGITNASAATQTFDVPVRLGQDSSAFTVSTVGDMILTNTVVASTQFVKEGTGTLAISDEQLAGMTEVQVNAGTLKLGTRTGKVTAASAGGTVKVAAGAAVDINESVAANAALDHGEATHGKTFEIAGAGPDGNGALVNSADPTGWISTFSKIVLTDDATIGGGHMGVRDLTGSAQSETSITGEHVLTVKNSNTYDGLTVKDAALNLQRLDLVGEMQLQGTATGTITEGIVAKDGSTLRFYGATLPATIPVTASENATVNVERDNGVSTVAGPVTVESGATLNVTGAQALTTTGVITNNGTIKLAGTTMYVNGTNDVMVGDGVYNIGGEHFWVNGPVNSPNTIFRVHGTSTDSSVALGDYVTGQPLPVFGGTECDGISNLWFMVGKNTVITNNVYDNLVNAASVFRLHTTPESTVTVSRVTWKPDWMFVGYKNARSGNLVLDDGANITVSGALQTATEGENVLPTSVLVKRGALLSSTSASEWDVIVGRFLSDTKTGGTGYIQNFTVDGGTFSVPNTIVQFGRGSDYVYTTLLDGLIDIKGMAVRTLTPYRKDLHDERFTQRGGELRIGSIGINSGTYYGSYMNWEHPHYNFANGTLTATDNFSTKLGRGIIAFGEEPNSTGSYTIDLAGKTLTWNSPLTGASDVTVTGAGSFTSSRWLQGIPLGRWTVAEDGTADLSGAAGFAKGLALGEDAHAYVDMGSTGVVEVVFGNRDSGLASNLATLKAFTGVCPYVAQSLAFLHEPGSTAAVSTYSTQLYRGAFFVPEEKAGTWYFAGTYDDYLFFEIDGTSVIETAGNSTVVKGSRELTAGWHEFRVGGYDATGGSGPWAADWKTAKMALGYSTDAAASGSVAASSYTRFDSDTLAFRLPTSPTLRTSMRFRALGLQGAVARDLNTFKRADQRFRGCDVVTNSFPILTGVNNQPLLSQNNARYEGWFYVSAAQAGNWTFTGKYDDGIALVVDGQTLLATKSYNDAAASGTISLTEGWHEFSISTYDDYGGYGATNKDGDNVTCAVTAKPAGAAKALAFPGTGANFQVVASVLDAQKRSAGGLGGVTTLAAGSKLENRATWGACPITGTLEGAGALVGRFAFAGGTWRVKGDNGRLTECADMTEVVNNDYLKGIAKIEADFTAGKASNPRYVMGPAGSLTAAEAAEINVEARDGSGIVPEWRATVIDGQLVIVNPKPSGVTIFIR